MAMGKIMVFVPLFLLALLPAIVFRGTSARGILLNNSTDNCSKKKGTNGKTWAVLVAGSSGFDNYRHQADVCHAYQLLKKGGLKDKNIVVFMYDDIANNPMNPKPGVIINKPGGPDVYAGVPKDYTGNAVNTKNLYAVLLGDKKGTKGGSGKVVDSKPGDRIFLYYSNHGAAGVLGMPSGPMLYADDFIKVLKKKHKMRTYKEMVIYVEACESGSMFEGLLPKDLNIYAMTASNAEESSWATYCPGEDSGLPPGLDTCLGDLFSVSWLEDSETHNLKKETIKEQYKKVKKRTSVDKTYEQGSHVMEYGTSKLRSKKLYLYQGFNPANANINEGALPQFKATYRVDQSDVQLLFLRRRYKKAKGHSYKATILKEIRDIEVQRLHVDSSVENIGKMLFGSLQSTSVLSGSGSANRSSDQPLVDDWDCLRGLVGVYEDQCGPLKQYGGKYMRAFANICNHGVSVDVMKEACMSACKA